MRRILIATLGVALLTGTVLAVRGAAAGPPAPAAEATAAAGHQHPAAATSGGGGKGLASQLAKARLATARYATSLKAAKADGYGIITRMIPDMGYHFLNPSIQGFDVTKPHILVYERRGGSWTLGALEWVSPSTPTTPPLPGATYGSFGAACHYKDGTFVFAAAQDDCAKRSPETGAAFNFWHPDLVTLHVWLWYHNPDGLYSGTNPLVQPFNRG
ncbi:MAG TPA: hypothetical protein VFU54_12005 [Actinomycetota bacterium]|nr:hypothetical protein [Actinomycetota bacterium]